MVEANVNSQANLFEPVEAEVRELEKSLVDTDKHLNPDSAVETLDNYFSCLICLQVVEEPKECMDCN